MSKANKKNDKSNSKPCLMGRLGTQLRIGILGLPNVGFDFLVDHYKPANNVCGHLNVVDIAGLVKGASQGQGLGNAFLADIRNVDALYHVVRIFEDEEIVHVNNTIDPIWDIQTINEELRLKDLEFAEKEQKKLENLAVRGNDKSKKAAYDCITKVYNYLKEGNKGVRFYEWTSAEIEILNEYLFLTSKPVIYLLNLSEKDFLRKKNSHLGSVLTWVKENDEGAPIIPFSVEFEERIIDSESEEVEKSALPKIINTGFKILNLKYFFTAGKDEVKAWIIQDGYKAPQAAGRIHTDMQKGFIAAEVMHYTDFKEQGSEAKCKESGKYLLKGRDYVVEDGDIIFFKFNTPNPGKKK